MIDYNQIKAFPTEYQGRLYRSRLEARWAAFFDLIGLNAEYEPYDLGAWSPDFLLSHSRDAAPGYLVEVKPITVCDVSLLQKAYDACVEKRFFQEHSNVLGIILLGVAPFRDEHTGIVHAGWCWSLEEGAVHPVHVVWVPDWFRPRFRCDLGRIDPEEGAYHVLLSRDGGALTNEDRPHRYADHTMELWATATNAVQWHPTTEGGRR